MSEERPQRLLDRYSTVGELKGFFFDTEGLWGHDPEPIVIKAASWPTREEFDEMLRREAERSFEPAPPLLVSPEQYRTLLQLCGEKMWSPSPGGILVLDSVAGLGSNPCSEIELDNPRIQWIDSNGDRFEVAKAEEPAPDPEWVAEYTGLPPATDAPYVEAYARWRARTCYHCARPLASTMDMLQRPSGHILCAQCYMELEKVELPDPAASGLFRRCYLCGGKVTLAAQMISGCLDRDGVLTCADCSSDHRATTDGGWDG